ncbi:fad-binding domain containing protein, partial [Colletotrichum incanum]
LADGIEIQWGKNLENITPGSNSVELVFRDGERFDANYVLGTDGVSSKVRELLMGVDAAKPVSSGFSIANCVCKYGDAEKVNAIVNAHSVCALMMGSGNMAGCGVSSVDDPNDMATWETFWVKVWRGHSVSLQGQEAIKYATKDLAGICEPFRSALEWTPGDSACYLDEMKYWLPSLWDTHDGRVTLAGDAAHPMLPFRGQGLQHAIIDAHKYICALTQLRDSDNAINRKEAISAYGVDVVGRGSTAVAQALKEAENALDVNTVGKMLMVTQGHGRSV